MRNLSYVLFLLFFCVRVGVGQSITTTSTAPFCAGTGITLTVTPNSGITGYQWVLSGTDIPGATSQSHVANTAGSYTVKLNRNSPLSDTTIGGAGFVINAAPVVPVFTFSTNNQCASTPFSFAITNVQAGVTYSWDFGDATSGTGTTISHTYNAFGNGTRNFSVFVVATNAAGCTARSITQVVSMKEKPNASLSDFVNIPAFTRCASTGSSIDFNLAVDNSTTTFATNNFYEVNWGDSTPSFSAATFPTTSSIPHTYTALGYFTITHRVSGQNGCQTISTYTVYNGSNPGVGISSSGSTIQQCIPASDTFFIDTVRTRNNPPGTTYTVSFNDGSPSLIFAHPPPISFVHTFNSSSCNAAGAINPNSFYVRIRAENPCGFLDGGVEPITTVTPPDANFTITPDTVACVNRLVTFLNTSVNGGVVTNGVCDNSTIINWSITPSTGWVISNGALGIANPSNNPATWGSQNLGITFTTPGVYAIKIIARNSANQGSPCRLDSIIKQVCITTAPAPDFNLNAINGCIPLLVNATDASIFQNVCRSATYRWQVTYTPAFCGTTSAFTYTNGTSDTSASPSFSFTSPGTYTLTQNVTNACGTFSSSKTIDVKKPPTVNINLPSYSCGAVSIIPAASIVACGTSTPTIAWTFAGGTPASSTAANPGTVNFTTVGDHPITLQVTNECGTTIALDTVVVSVAPDVIVPANLVLCGGFATGNLNFTSTNGTPGYTWTNSNPSIGLPASGAGNIASFIAINTGTTPQLATIIVTPAVSSCAGTPDTFTITVNPRPATPVVSTPVTYCKNETASVLTSTGTGTLTWYNNPGLTGGTAVAPTPNTANTGSTNFYVTQANSFGCRSDSAIITVQVNPGITGNVISSNQTICAGTSPNSIGLGTVSGGSGVYNYQWQQSQDGGSTWTNIAGAVNDNYSPGVLTDTIRYRRVVTSTPCADTSNIVVINVAGALSNINITAAQEICEGFAPALLTGQLPNGGGGGYSYTWQQSTNGFTWSNVGGNTPDFQPPVLTVTTSFRRITDAAQCSATSNVVVVTVNPKPVASITSAGDICIYDSAAVTFNATAGTAPFAIELVITRPGGSTDTIRQSVNNNGPVDINVIDSNSAAGIYSIVLNKITDSKGCERTNVTPAVTIAVKPLPVLTLTNSSPICNGVSATLTAAGATTYNWSPNTNLNTTSGTTVLATPPATTTYFVRGTLNGCFKDTSTIVTVIAGAVAADAGADQRLCNVATTTLNGNSPSLNATGNWRQVSGPAAVIADATLPNTGLSGLQPGRTYVMEWRITGQAPCPPTNSTVTIDVFSPITNSIKRDTIICAGQSATINTDLLAGGITDAISAAYTFEWESTPAGTSNWQIMSGETTETLTVTPAASTCYRRKVKTNNLCESISNEICVTVNPAITGNSISADQQVCVNLPVAGLLGSTPAGGDGTYVYEWFTSRDAVNWISVGSQVNYQPPVYPVAGTHYFRRDVTSGNCTSSSDQVVITIHPNAKAIFTAADTSACARFDLATTINVTHLPDSNGTYNWYADDVLFGSNTTGIFPGYTINNSGDTVVIKLVTTSPFGCQADSIEQSFITFITAVARFSKDTAGGCGPLTVNFTNTSNLINSNIVFAWDFGNGITSSLAQPPPVTFVQSPYFNDTSYQITLKAYNGCDTTIWKDSITVRSNPKARFGINATFGCSPFNVVLTNTSLGEPNVYYWDFGNGHLDTTYANGQLNYTYNIGNTVDTFPIRMIAVNECASDTQVINVRVAPNLIRPQVTINGSDLFGCTPHIVSFNNATTGATRFIWNFGDGTVPDTTNNNQTAVLHTFNTPGVFTVAIAMSNGCSDTTVFRQVTVFEKPIALFTASAPQYCSGDTIRVNNTSSNASNYTWFWGDGQTSTGVNPVHVYAVGGSYNIVLRAEKTNNSGIVCFDTLVQSVSVLNAPETRIQTNLSTVSCAPFTLTASAPGITNEVVTWYITDTTASPNLIVITGLNAQYTFNRPGTFSIKMVAVNAAGCTDSSTQVFTVRGTQVAAFSIANQTFCTLDTTITYRNETTFNDFGPLTYQWRVDGQLRATSGNFTYRYTASAFPLPQLFTTQLIAINTVGCSDTATGVVQLNPNPIAAFTILNPRDCVPFVPIINNASQYGNTYQWYLNGVLVDTAMTPSITIPLPATLYRIRLIVSNAFNCRPDTMEVSFTSTAKPAASFAVSDTLGCTDILNVVTSNSTTNANAYRWDWGDGSAGSSFINPTHLYNQLGQYRITLVASDGVCNDTASRLVSVANKPVVDFTADNVRTCDTARVQFTNLSSNADSYLWTFSNGTTSTDASPYQLFAPSNTPFTVKLVASNVFGCKDSLVKGNLITSIVPPLADFFISPSPVISIPNYSFDFINTTTENVNYTYQWNLGDGTVGSTRDISRKYADTGTYPIRLIVFDNTTGCPDTLIKFAKIEGQPGYLYVPNAFYPNSLQNQFRSFKPTGKGLASYQFQVFDAWGKLLFQSNELDAAGSPVAGWDGTFKGNPMPQDAYAWRIKAVFRNGRQWEGMSYGKNNNNTPGHTFGTVTLFR